MAVILKLLLKFIIAFFTLFLVSCRTAQFANNGFFTAEVDKYFNEKEGVNIWVYQSFQPRETENTGLRTKNLYPLDNRMMKKVGLGRKGDKILFTVVPDSKPTYNMLVVKHKKRRFKTENFEQKVYEKAPFYQKDYSEDGIHIKHVYIPFGKKESISLLFYALTIEGDVRNKPIDRFDYLAKINALELYEEKVYKPTWQIFDCYENIKTEWTLKPNLELLKGNDIVYLKLYEVYENSNMISFFKLMKADDLGAITLKLCPNNYLAEYYNAKGDLLDKSEFTVSQGEKN